MLSLSAGRVTGSWQERGLLRHGPHATPPASAPQAFAKPSGPPPCGCTCRHGKPAFNLVRIQTLALLEPRQSTTTQVTILRLKWLSRRHVLTICESKPAFHATRSAVAVQAFGIDLYQRLLPPRAKTTDTGIQLRYGRRATRLCGEPGHAHPRRRRDRSRRFTAAHTREWLAERQAGIAR
jgi:hypothetical protein